MQTLTASNFDAFLRQREVAVVLLFAAWEVIHLKVTPVLEELETLFLDVSFGALNVDEPSFTADFHRELGIFNVPATLYYKNGERVQISVGIGYPEIYQQQAKRTLHRLLAPTGA